MEAVDRQHPTRVAIVRGPAVFVMDAGRHEPVEALPDEDKLDGWLTLDDGPPVFPWMDPTMQQTTVFRMPPFKQAKGERAMTTRWRPFYSTVENWRYRLYFDRKDLPMVLW
jgi:hypothetical protein